MIDADTIIAALTAGAAAGTSNAATAAVQDAYTELRDAIRRRLTAPKQVAVLDAAHQDVSTAWQSTLGQALVATGADHDERVLAAAARLLDLIEPPGKYRVDLREASGVQVGDGNVQHNAFS